MRLAEFPRACEHPVPRRGFGACLSELEICVSFLPICFLGDIDLDLNDRELNPDTDDLSRFFQVFLEENTPNY